LIFPLHTFFLQTPRARKISVSILKTEGRLMIWARMLSYITGSVDQELLVRNEYLVAENRILRARIKGRLLLSDSEKTTLAEIAHRLGRKALAEVAATAKPDTLLGWYRKLIAQKFDGSRFRKCAGRPPVDEEIEGSSRADREGKSHMGLRPDRGRNGESGVQGF
jgi:hypothetical protein